MIEINLLPPERRPVERTPFPRLVTIFVGVAVVSAEIFFSLILFFFTIPQKTKERDTMKITLQTKQEEAKRADELEKQIAEVDERRKVIESLYTQRQEWTPVFDHLDEPEVLPDEIWLTSFEITPATDKAGSGKITGFARGKSPETTVGKFIANMNIDEKVRKAFSKIEFVDIKVVGLKTKSSTEKPGAAAPAGSSPQNVIPAMASQFTISLEIPPLKVVEDKTNAPGKKTTAKPAAKKK